MTAALTSVGIQQVSITIANGATSGTATITAVGSGAFIVHQGQTTTDSTTFVSALARVEITNSTTITATRNTSSTDTITVNAVIVDGDTTNFVETVQNITTTILTAATTGTTTVTAVTNADTFIEHLGVSTATAFNTLTRTAVSVALASTTVTATRGAATGAIIVGSCVVELQPSATASSTQNITILSDATNTEFSTTITSVTMTSTFIANGGAVYTLSGTATRTQFARLALKDATTATATVNTAPFSAGTTYACVIVELDSALLAQNIQRGTISLAAATSNTATITSSPTAETMVNWLGNSSNQAAISYNIANYKVTQTNATTITETANSSATGVGGYEAIDFNPSGGAVRVPDFMPFFL